MDVQEKHSELSVSEWRELQNSTMWKELREAVSDRISALQDLMLIPEEAREPLYKSDDRIKGGIIELRAFLEFPSVMICELEAERKVKNAGTDK